MTLSPAQSMPRAGYQGAPGAFSESAACHFFPNGATLVPCPSFDDLFAAFNERRVEVMVAPVENTIAGKVERVAAFLRATPHRVLAEVELVITQSLIAIPGARLEDVRSAESHPVALAQCRRFFAAHPDIRPVEADDTAASVRRIMAARDPSRAAIAGDRASEIYGATVLIAGIQDHGNNVTRFQLVAPIGGEGQ